MFRRHVVLVGCLLGTSNCNVDLQLPPGSNVECSTIGECPTGSRCDLAREICVDRDEVPANALAVGTVEAVGRTDAIVPISFSVRDPEGGDVSVVVEYTRGDPLTNTWYVATELSGSELPSPLPGDTDEQFVFMWDALTDAADGATPVARLDVDTTGDGTPDMPTLGYAGDLYLRIVATDSADEAGAATASGPFEVGNDAPVPVVMNPNPPLADNVVLAFTVFDSAADPAEVELQFRVGTSDLWRTPFLLFGAITDLLATPVGTPHAVLWDTRVSQDGDPSVPQGIGGILGTGVQIRARGRDTAPSGASHYSPWSAAVDLADIVNQTPARVQNVRARRAELAGGMGPLPVGYTVVDLEGDPVDIEVEFSFDLGTTWNTCIEWAVPQSEGRYDLATSPVGLRHTFWWDTSAVTFDPEATTLLRLRVSDGLSGGNQVTVPTARPVAPPVGTPPPFLLDAGSGVGQTTNRLRLVHLDDDGVLDIVSASPQVVEDISVAFGDGDGTFSGLVELSSGLGNRDFDLANLDDSGGIDIVYTVSGNASSPTNFFVVLNDGMGGFTPSPTADLGHAPRGIVARDFDGNGDVDVAVTVFEPAVAATVFTLAGNGNGTFGTPVPYPVGTIPLRIGATDFDGDAVLDLLVLESTGEVHLLRGLATPAGTFAPAELIGGADEGSGLAAVDLDADGYGDVVTTQQNDDQVTVLYGAPSGNAVEQRTWPLGTGPHEPVVVDLNGDDTLDIVTGSSSDGIFVLLGSPNLGGPPRVFTQTALDTGTVGVRGVDFGDLNGDGRSDLIFSPQGGSNIYPMLASPLSPIDASSFSFVGDTAMGFTEFKVVVADLNEDGAMDAVTRTGDTLRFWSGAGGLGVAGESFSGSFSLAFQLDVLEAVDFVHGDIDGDGIGDIVVSQGGQDQLTLLLGNGSGGIGDGTFSPSLVETFGDAAGLLNLRDMDRDGKLDIVMSLAGAGGIAVLINTSTPGAPSWTPSSVVLPGRPSAMVSNDINGDGAIDVVVAYRAPGPSDEAAVWLNDGFGSLSGTTPINIGGRPASMAITDLDGNGRLDVVYGMTTPATLGVLTGEVGGLVSAVAFDPGPVSRLNLGDYNGDGLTDILGGSGSAVEQWGIAGQELNGIPVLPNGASPMEDLGFTGDPVRYVDLNADGIEDVVSYFQDNLEVHLGTALKRSGVGWRRVVAGTPTTKTDLMAVGPSTIPVGTDRFGQARVAPIITVRPPQAGLGEPSFLSALRVAPVQDLGGVPVTLPPVLTPLTLPWETSGIERLTVVHAHPASPESGPRLRIEPRLGDRVAPASNTDFARTGLDGAGGRFVVLELPIVPGRTNGELAGASLHVFMRAAEWVRASEVSTDPISGEPDAGRYLPRVPGAGGAFRDVVTQRFQWTEIPPGALSSGCVPCFETVTDEEPRRVRVATDELGVLQAFFEGP